MNNAFAQALAGIRLDQRNRNENEDKNMKKTAGKLIAFIKESPDAFHAAAAVSERLEEKGYQKLAEKGSLVSGSRKRILCDKKRVRSDCISYAGKKITDIRSWQP